MSESIIELVSFMIGIKFVHEKFNVWTGSKPEFSLSPMNDNGLDTEEILKSTLFLYVYFIKLTGICIIGFIFKVQLR